MEEFEIGSCVHGYHVYKNIWATTAGEELMCEREPHNMQDGYAVSVKRGGVVVGHLPRKISRLCSLFLRLGGTIICTVSGGRRYSVNLPQGA